MKLIGVGMLVCLALLSCEGNWYPHEPEAYGDDEYCETDMECYQVCLAKLPENRSEGECDDILGPK